MIALGCDHGGFHLKLEIMRHFDETGVKYMDCGHHSTESVDYPDIAKQVCQTIKNGICDKGILICGTGIGMSIAANKISGIRAACCSDVYSAQLTRQHNDANILCIGERVVGTGLGLMLADTFINTEFEGGRHLNRICKIED